MIIVIDDYAVNIDKENGCFKLSTDDNIRLVSPHKVTAIHICRPCNLSTPAIMLASEFNIPILIFNNKGQVVSRLWQPDFGSLSIIRHHQLYFSRSHEGLVWVARSLALKTGNQLGVLHYCQNRVQSAIDDLSVAVNTIEKLNPFFTNTTFTETELRTTEAQCSKQYWQALSVAMENYSPFGKRTRRPAVDRFNSLINYGYGMLYAMVESAALTAGLDPHTGILHTEQYNRPSFVFDAIEPFRQWIDKLVVDMALKDEIEDTYFEPAETGSGVLLAKEGKKEYIPRINAMMNEATLFNGKRIKRKDQVQHLLTTLAQYLLKEYKPPRHHA